jgi:hypothetical protein
MSFEVTVTPTVYNVEVEVNPSVQPTDVEVVALPTLFDVEVYPTVLSFDVEVIAYNDLKTAVEEAQQYAEDAENSAIAAQQAAADIIQEKRHDWVSPYSYLGKAPENSSESANVWTITRMQVAVDGSTTVLSASNVAWSNRYSVIYS